MAHPLATKTISSGRVKNDAVDARTLAHLLRANLLPEAWITPPDVREAPRLVRMRVSLVRMRSRLKDQVHALCADADADVPVPVSDLFGRAGRELLSGLALRPTSAGRLAASLRLIDDLGREIVEADRELMRLYRNDDRILWGANIQSSSSEPVLKGLSAPRRSRCRTRWRRPRGDVGGWG